MVSPIGRWSLIIFHVMFVATCAAFAAPSGLNVNDSKNIQMVWEEASDLVIGLTETSNGLGPDFLCFAVMIEQVLSIEADLRIAFQMAQVVEFLDSAKREQIES